MISRKQFKIPSSHIKQVQSFKYKVVFIFASPKHFVITILKSHLFRGTYL